MDQTQATHKIARTLLPYLESLYLARAQALKQYKMCAGQHKQYWLVLMDDIAQQIKKTERQITVTSPLGKFERINN